MKKWIHVLAVVAIVGATIWGMTSTATEKKGTEDVILVEFDYIEEFEPQTLYALDGAEIFQGAGFERKIGNLEAGTPIFCYQKTTNGFYYGSASQQGGFYISVKAVTDKPQKKEKAPKEISGAAYQRFQ